MMRYNFDRSVFAKSQQGAALVIGLLLLVALTLLAIASMNTASLEFIMAGNEGYRHAAQQAAEIGIENTYSGPGDDYNPDAKAALKKVDLSVPGTADTYDTTLTPQLCGRSQKALPGYKEGAFVTYHFQIKSIGHSMRNSRDAQATHWQGVATLAPVGETVLPDTPTADCISTDADGDETATSDPSAGGDKPLF
jgi:type IV pilus assembly protein PilX